MKRVSIIIGLAVSVLIGTAVLVPLLIDWNRFKPLVTRAVSETLGRELVIDGELRVGLAPVASVTLSGLQLANADGMAGPHMATIERIDADVRLFPLLGGRLVLDRLDLINPEISLEIAADGRPNWRFEPADAKPVEATGGSLPVQAIVLGSVNFRGGRIGFTNHRSGQALTLQDLSLSGTAAARGASPDELIASLSGKVGLGFAALTLPAGPVRQLRDARVTLELPADGGGASLGVEATAVGGSGAGLPLVVAVRTSPLAELLTEGADPFELRGTLGSVKLDLAGKIPGTAAGPAHEFTLAIESESLAALDQLLDARLPDLRPATLSAKLALEERHYRLAGLVARLGASDLSGDLDLRLDGERPSIEGKLASNRLDLVEALQPGVRTPAPDPARGSSRSRVLSDAPLPLDLLQQVDADLAMRVGELRLDADLALDEVHFPLVLNAGRLTSAPIEAGLFGGRVQGRLGVDATAKVPTVELALDAQRIGVTGLLGRMALFEPRNATAQLSVDLRGSGRSPRELAANASGRAELSAQGGVLNLGAARLLTIGIADILRPLLGGTSETRLECLLIRYRLQDGIARSDAQVLSTNAFAVVGAGSVDLRTEKIDLHFRTQANSPSLMSFAVPFEVSGTLGDPKAGPDAEGSLLSVFKVAGSILDPVYALSVLAPGKRPRAGQTACAAALEQAEGGIVERATDAAAGAATGAVEGVGDVLEGVGGALGDLLGR
jgi:AsmA family protein